MRVSLALLFFSCLSERGKEHQSAPDQAKHNNNMIPTNHDRSAAAGAQGEAAARRPNGEEEEDPAVLSSQVPPADQRAVQLALMRARLTEVLREVGCSSCICF